MVKSFRPFEKTSVILITLMMFYFGTIYAQEGKLVKDSVGVFSSLEGKLQGTVPTVINELSNAELRAGKLAEIKKDGSSWTLYESIPVGLLITSKEKSLEDLKLIYYLEGFEELDVSLYATWQFEFWEFYFTDALVKEGTFCGPKPVGAVAVLDLSEKFISAPTVMKARPKFIKAFVFVPWNKGKFQICLTTKPIEFSAIAMVPGTPKVAEFVLESHRSSEELQLGIIPTEDLGNAERWISFIKRSLSKGFAAMYDTGKSYVIYWHPTPWYVKETPPKITLIKFKPEQPIASDSSLQCCVYAEDTDSKTLEFEIKWYIKPRKAEYLQPSSAEEDFSFYSSSSGSGEDHYCNTLNISPNFGERNIDQVLCLAEVSDGKARARMAAKVSISYEEGEEVPEAEEKDSDRDGVPDSTDKCPYKKGSPQNSGCPAPKPEKPETKDKIPKVGKDVKVMFIFMPIDWQGSNEDFKKEVNNVLSTLKEASGCGEDLNYHAIILPKEVQSQPNCNIITLQKCIDTAELLRDVYKCVLSATGITLNNPKIVFVGLTNKNPLESKGKFGFKMMEEGTCKEVSIIGFHIPPSVAGGTDTEVTIAIIDKVHDPLYQAPIHELGHTLGFCEQYSILDHLRQDITMRAVTGKGCTNKYPGPYTINDEDSISFPARLGVPYPKCPDEIPSTYCPEIIAVNAPVIEILQIEEKAPTKIQTTQQLASGRIVQIIKDGYIVPKKLFLEEILVPENYQALQKYLKQLNEKIETALPSTDCLGRITEYGNARSAMGPSPNTLSIMGSYFPSLGTSKSTPRIFDCFEKEVIRREWCG